LEMQRNVNELQKNMGIPSLLLSPSIPLGVPLFIFFRRHDSMQMRPRIGYIVPSYECV